MKVNQDRARFREILRGRIRRNLRKYISSGEIIARSGKDVITVPVPHIDIPRFRYETRQQKGVGQGDGEPGDPLSGEEAEGQEGGKQAGDQPGDHMLEEEISIGELAQILGEELELPRIEHKGKERIVTVHEKLIGVRRAGPESLRHFKRTFKEALKRQIASGTYDQRNPLIIPIKEDRRYKSFRKEVIPETNAVLIYIMDVSGSMGDEQKEIVRIESFWIDTWLRSQYKGIECRYIIHDATAKEVDRETFFRTKESGGTIISTSYKQSIEILDSDYPESEWNVYIFQFSDGDNWSNEDNKLCVKLLRDDILPRTNLFCYGQVESPYGSGQFLKELKEHFTEDQRVAMSNIPNRDAIVDSIKEFMGKGK
jgi:sporulation protein YhbH